MSVKIELEITDDGVELTTSENAMMHDVLYGAMVLIMNMSQHIAEEEQISEKEAFDKVLNFIKDAKSE